MRNESKVNGMKNNFRKKKKSLAYFLERFLISQDE